MKKNIIIVGHPESGKSTLAKGFMADFNEDKRQIISGRGFSNNKNGPYNLGFLFNQFRPDSEVIMIDDIHPDLYVIISFHLKTGLIKINPKGQLITTISPFFILVFSKNIKTKVLNKRSFVHQQFNIFRTKKIS